MECGKYIIKVVNGHEVAILFDSLISHDCIGTCRGDKGETVSAGFFSVMAKASEHDPDDISVGCWGKSVTLNMESRKEQDEPLIKKVLRKDYY